MDYRELLRQEFSRRKYRFGSYSLRRFARDLDLSVSVLSYALNGVRHLSRSNLLRAATKLRWADSDVQLFLRTIRKYPSDGGPINSKRDILAYREHELLSKWYYLAIYHLTEIQENEATPDWISERIGISRDQAAEALELLLAKRLIRVNEGRIVRSGRKISFVEHPPSEAMTTAKQRIVEFGAKSLREVDDRKQISLVRHLTIRERDLPRLARAIWKTGQELDRVSKKGDKLYYLTVQLFPVKR